MKRLISAFLLIAILLSLAACGGSAKPESTVKPETNLQTTPEPTPTCSPEPTPTPEPTPAISISIENMTGNRTVDGFEVGYYSCDYPRLVVNYGDSEKFDELNMWVRDIAEDTEVAAESMLEEAENAYRSFPQMFTSSYFYNLTIDKLLPADDIIVLFIDSSMYLGGAHPGNSHLAWVIDTELGKVLSLSDLGDADAIISAASADIIAQIKADEMETYMFPDYADAIPSGIYDGFWYITDEGFWVIYPEYAIAPYSEGTFVFNVGFDKLNSLIKEEYII